MFKRIFAVLGAAILLFVLSSCGTGPNYDGDGNDFVVTGTVKEVVMTGFLWDSGYHEVKLDPATARVVSAYGEASGWFTRSGFLYSPEDNFTFCTGYRDPRPNSWTPVFEDVGEIRNAAGYSAGIDQLKAGDTVRITGKIHASKSGKSSSYRSVFHRIEVTNGR